MTFILEIPADLSEGIEQMAILRGLDAGAFIIEAIRCALDPDAAFDALLDQFAGEPSPRELAGFDALPDEAMNRESFYEPDEESGM